MAIASDDFDADGLDEPEVGLVSDARTISFVELVAGLSEESTTFGREIDLGARPAERSISLRMAAGNIDHDRGAC